MVQYNKFKLRDSFLNYIGKISPNEYCLPITKQRIIGFTYQAILNLGDFASQNSKGEPTLSTFGGNLDECINDARFMADYLFDNKIELKVFDNFLSHIFDFTIETTMKNICIEHLIEKRRMSVLEIRNLIKSKGVLGSPHSWDLLDEYEAKAIIEEKEKLSSNIKPNKIEPKKKRNKNNNLTIKI